MRAQFRSGAGRRLAVGLFAAPAGALVAAALLLSSCGESDEQASSGEGGSGPISEVREWRGDRVRVQFRRDFLGGATQLPVGPMTSEINGAQVSIIGKLEHFHEKGVILDLGPGADEKSKREVWIPREAILLLERNP